jgi:hypothetical protein
MRGEDAQQYSAEPEQMFFAVCLVLQLFLKPRELDFLYVLATFGYGILCTMQS